MAGLYWRVLWSVVMQTDRQIAPPPQETRLGARPPAVQAELSRTQKASIVLAVLGPNAAAPILKELTAAQLQRFALAITGLRQVPNAVLEDVITEFLEELAGKRDLTTGTEIARQLLGQVMDDAEVSRLLDRLSAPTERMVWDQLGAMPPPNLARILQVEHPQTIAVILSELRASEAAAVLEYIEPEIGQRAVLRLSRPPRLSPDVSAILSKTLEENLLADMRDKLSVAKPADMIAGMMNNLSSNVRALMLERLSDETPDLSAEVQKVMFTFADIAKRVAERDVSQIVRSVDEDTLLTALKTSDDMRLATTPFILGNISKRLAERFAEQIEQLEEVPQKAGEQAQAIVIAAIQKLAQDGEITLIDPHA